ncbi:inositol monophosphatase family protein [Lentilactobacillus senioris]|uniref:inositol monophosphatase family protein n=1 Tax=Lentilactobacillus senioris TaxID=931534 RepID=UPI003D2B897D
MNENEKILNDITHWVLNSGKFAKENVEKIQKVSQKSGEYDLVTNLDIEIEKEIEAQIHINYPDAVIVGEEAPKENITKNEGLTFYIDPIDGTLNLVKKHDCFVIMVGVYRSNEPVGAAMLDVMNERLYWGNPEVGVYCNEQKLSQPENTSLRDGLVGVSWRQFLGNNFGEIRIAQKSAGVRVMGSAGLEFIELMTGKHTAYLATLNPWDFVPGQILAESLGIKVMNANGNRLNRFKVNHLIAGTPQAYRAIKNIQNF